MSSSSPPPRPLRHSLRARLLALLAALVLLPVGGVRAEEESRDLEPTPRLRVFAQDEADRLDPETSRQIREVISRSFASLGDIEAGRRLLVRRFGLRSAPEVTLILRGGRNVTRQWNAALTVGALRDVAGASSELLPALKPLLRILRSQSDEAHLPGFAALALGCFPWPEGQLSEAHRERLGYYEAVPGAAERAEAAVSALQEVRRALGERAADKLAFTSMAALFALAKVGGEAARDALLGGLPAAYANTGPERALLLARAFLGTEDGRAYRDGLRDEDRRVRGAAALAMAVAMLHEDPVEWTREARTILKRLKGALIKMDREDGAEALFARGICALRNQSNEEWREIWKIAIQASTKLAVTEAASQTLLFCREPWFEREVLKWSVSGPLAVEAPVRGMLLLRAAALGSDAGIHAAEHWLRNKGRKPAANNRWDPRWYAAIGLLRALHHGNMAGPHERRRAVDTLRHAAAQVLDRRSALRAALVTVLEKHGDKLSAPNAAHAYRLPLAALRAVEGSFTCPFGLLAQDPVDVCAKRVNDTVYACFGLDRLAKNKPGVIDKQPERYLRRCLIHYPYFSRLEFRTARGFRSHGRMYVGDPKGIDK